MESNQMNQIMQILIKLLKNYKINIPKKKINLVKLIQNNNENKNLDDLYDNVPY